MITRIVGFPIKDIDVSDALGGLFGGIFLVGDVAEMFARHMHDGHGGYVFDGDDDGQIFLDVAHDASHTCVGAIGDAGFHAWLAGKVEIVEEDDVASPFFGHPDELLHHAVGDIEGFGGGLLAVEDGVHDVAERLVEELVPTHLGQMVVGALHEDDIVDGWHQGGAFIHCLVHHRHIGLLHQLFLVQTLLHRHEA